MALVLPMREHHSEADQRDVGERVNMNRAGKSPAQRALRINRKGALAAVAVGAIVTMTVGTSAVAAHLTTSRDIKDNTIRSIDVRDGAVHKVDLSRAVQVALAKRAVNGQNGK